MSEVRCQRTEGEKTEGEKTEVRGHPGEIGKKKAFHWVKRSDTDRLECFVCGLEYFKDGPQISQISAD